MKYYLFIVAILMFASVFLIELFALERANASSNIMTSTQQAAECEAKLAQLETELAQIRADQSIPSPSPRSMTVWVLVALALGMIIGGGAVYFGYQKQLEHLTMNNES